MKLVAKCATCALTVCFAVASGLCGSVKVPASAREELFSEEQMLAPFWQGDVSYNESIMPVAEKDGEILPIDLLYPIDEVIEVRSADLLVRYEEGVDYEVRDGKFVVVPGGGIKRLSYDEFHPTDGQSGFEARGGGYVLWKEGAWYHQRQTVVTYRHAAGYTGYIPEGKGRLLPNVREKLEAGDDITLLVYGDSISTGANSSGHKDIRVSPFMPTYPELFARGIELTYGVKVTLYNPSVGGTDSAWGISNLRGGVLDKYDDVDLAVIAFGMNDANRDAESLAVNVSRIARGLKSKYKGVDSIAVATMLPNYDAYRFYGNQVNFYEGLMKYEGEGFAVANMTGVHAALLERKSFADMTGNNVNHANDYLARVYAQTLLRTLEISSYGEAEEPVESASSETDPTEESAGSSEGVSIPDPAGSGCGGAASGLPIAAFFALVGLAAVKRFN